MSDQSVQASSNGFIDDPRFQNRQAAECLSTENSGGQPIAQALDRAASDGFGGIKKPRAGQRLEAPVGIGCRQSAQHASADHRNPGKNFRKGLMQHRGVIADGSDYLVENSRERCFRMRVFPNGKRGCRLHGRMFVGSKVFGNRYARPYVASGDRDAATEGERIFPGQGGKMPGYGIQAFSAETLAAFLRHPGLVEGQRQKFAEFVFRIGSGCRGCNRLRECQDILGIHGKCSRCFHLHLMKQAV